MTEALSEFIILDEYEQRFRRSFRSVRIPKEDITQVNWTKSAGASLKLAGAKWVMVPDMGHNSRSLTNSLRARAKASAGVTAA